jgi:hypothetical protein
MNIGDNTNNNKDVKKEITPKISEEIEKYTPKKYPRAWEIELTDEQRENLKRSIEEDEKKYKEMGKRLAEDRDYSKLFNKKS